MTKEKPWKETDARKSFVHKHIAVLKDSFFLTGWEITINHNKYPCQENPNVTAECKPSWSYRRATIEIYPLFWEYRPDEERKDILKHEFCHVLLCPLLELVSSLQKGRMVSDDEVHAVNEHTTSWVASLIK